ncbi:MAG: hypothetical protein R3E34_11745 [Rhodocyclaceae bacterium]
MRSYRNDSAEAAARITSLAMLVDGGLDRRKLRAQARRRVSEDMGMSAENDTARLPCNDLLQCSAYWKRWAPACSRK